jgi:hypothetical protein
VPGHARGERARPLQASVASSDVTVTEKQDPVNGEGGTPSPFNDIWANNIFDFFFKCGVALASVGTIAFLCYLGITNKDVVSYIKELYFSGLICACFHFNNN